MKLLLRFCLALFGVCSLLSTSQAFWWHKQRHGHAAGACAPGACAPAGSCAAPPSAPPPVTYTPVTKDYVTTRYKAVVSYVPEQVVNRVTTWVPAAPAAPAGLGCTGMAPAGAGCHGFAPAAGCHGAVTAPGGGCTGMPPGASNSYHIGSLNSDYHSPRLAQIETKLATIEAKISALTTAVADLRADGKAPDRVLPPIPSLPTPATPASATKPSAVGSAAPADEDPLLAAALAYKARRAVGKDPGPTPAPPAGERGPQVTSK